MKQFNEGPSIYQDDLILDCKQTIAKLSILLNITKHYYMHIHYDTIEQLLDMLERAKKSLDGHCYIHEQDFIVLYQLIQFYENQNTSLTSQKLGAYYLNILAGDAQICLQLLQKAIQASKSIPSDVLSFFQKLVICLHSMAIYESITNKEETITLPYYSIIQ